MQIETTEQDPFDKCLPVSGCSQFITLLDAVPSNPTLSSLTPPARPAG